jgi:hypothetical protein
MGLPFSYSTEDGTFQIQLLLNNSGESPVLITVLCITFFDNSGNILEFSALPDQEAETCHYGNIHNGFGLGGLDKILPNEEVPVSFTFSLQQVPDWAYYGFVLKAHEEQLDSEIYTDFDITISNIEQSDESKIYYSATGDITNTGSQRADFIYVRALFFDSNGTYLGVGEGVPLRQPLPPGSSSPLSSFYVQGVNLNNYEKVIATGISIIRD